MIITLDDAKNFLKVDSDITDDDALIQVMIDGSEEYLISATGKTFDSTNNRARIVSLMMVFEWYQNRDNGWQLGVVQSSMLNNLITQLAMSRDVPPLVIQVPAGLTAVPETGYVLVRWLANIDPSLDGYNVYRNGVMLNAELVREDTHWMEWPLAWGDWPYPQWISQQHDNPGVIAFYDKTAVAGQTYSYQVTAVDTLGNESAKTTAVQVTAT